jgi:hypothetical protein
MTITINTNKLLGVVIGVLLILYAVNIFFTNQLINAWVDEPVALTFTLISAPDCERCVDPKQIVSVIDAAHNIDYETSVVEFDSTIGAKYIDMYGIAKLPAVVVSGDVRNERVLGAWESFRGRTVDDSIIIDDLIPFYDLAERKNKGVVDVVILMDSSCESCLDPNAYLGMVQKLGLAAGEVLGHDLASAEGSALIKNYQITKLPAVLLSPDASEYENLDKVWQEVGTIEEDGWYVFREVQKISSDFTTL